MKRNLVYGALKGGSNQSRDVKPPFIWRFIGIFRKIDSNLYLALLSADMGMRMTLSRALGGRPSQPEGELPFGHK